MTEIPSSPPIRYAADQLALEAGYMWKPEVELIPYQRFINEYCLLDADWNHQPMQLLDYQVSDLVGPMLGWVNDKGILRHTESLIYSPKKIGKSAMCASLLAYWAATKKGQNCRLIASTVDQANVMFAMLCQYTNHPVLEKRWHIQDGRKTITDRVTKSTIKVMPCRPSGISGPKIHLLVLDEYSEHPAHAARKVWDRVKFAGAANINGRLTVVITTPAHELDTLGYEQWVRARSIQKSEKVDELRTHACVYGAEPEDDWEKEETWKKAGPHIGKLVPLSFYQEEYIKAKGNPQEELAFRIYLLGQYVRNHKVFVDMPSYYACGTDDFPDFTQPDANGKKRRVCIGLDSGGANDLLAISILIPHDEKVYVIPKAVISRECLRKKTKVGQLQYQAWADKGLIEIVGDNTIQLPQLLRLLQKEYDRYDVAALAYDPWQLKGLQEEYERQNRLIIETPQYGRYMNPLILDFERRIKEKTIVHPNHPVLDFCVENLQVIDDKYGRLQCDKDQSRTKIDLAVSTIIGLNALPECEIPVWNMPSVMSL